MFNYFFGKKDSSTTSPSVQGSAEMESSVQAPTPVEIFDEGQDGFSTPEPSSLQVKSETDTLSANNDSSNQLKKMFCHWHGDCSGSMQSMGNAGCNEGQNFCSEWRSFADSNPKIETEMSFYTFSAEGNLVFRGNPSTMTDDDIQKCGRAMTPSSTTCLFDTAVPQAQQFLASINAAYNGLGEDEKKSKTIKQVIGSTFMLMTDGVDNMSNKYNSNDLKKVFGELKDVGTTVCFAAANMDAVTVGSDYGLDQNTCLQMGSDEKTGKTALRAMTDAAIRTATRSRDSNEESYVVFTQEERYRSCDPEEAAKYTKKVPKKFSLF